MKDQLTAARARIADPAHWIKGSFAMTAAGRTIGPACPNAICWCLVGTLRADDNDPEILFTETVKFVTEIIKERFSDRYHNAPAFNDHKDTTHAMVLAVLDEAIARC